MNWFNTLNEALNSEGLLDTWSILDNISYGQTFRYFSAGECISIYRDERGMYERPIHYKSLQG